MRLLLRRLHRQYIPCPWYHHAARSYKCGDEEYVNLLEYSWSLTTVQWSSPAMARIMYNSQWALGLLLSLCVQYVASSRGPWTASNSPLERRQNLLNASAPLVNFQVYQPVLTPEPAKCTQLLMEHVFAFSYGHPFVGK